MSEPSMSNKTVPHTPGPWHYQEKADAYTHIVRGQKNWFVCQLKQDSSGLAEADARLIAAAPELLELCERTLQEIDENDSTIDLCCKLRLVIAKAKGDAPGNQLTKSGRVHCTGCGHEIDPDICCCGTEIDGYHDNHFPVPMGCRCYESKGGYQ